MGNFIFSRPDFIASCRQIYWTAQKERHDKMDENLTISDLKTRWQKVLNVTKLAVSHHPSEYREIKTLAHEIVNNPLDIKEYIPTVKKLTSLLSVMDQCGQGTIFHHFNERIRPSNIWQIDLLRVECKDLLDHLRQFDQWRLKAHHLKVVK